MKVPASLNATKMLKISQLKQNKEAFIKFLFEPPVYTDNLCIALLDFFHEDSSDDLDKCFSSQKNRDWFKDNIMRPNKDKLYVEDPEDINGDDFVGSLFSFYVKR